MDNTELIERIQDALNDAREALEDFRRGQDPATADESNEEHIAAITAGLDQAEGAIGDLVP